MITADQRARAQANRARALAIKRRKAEEAASPPAPPAPPSTASSSTPASAPASASSASSASSAGAAGAAGAAGSSSSAGAAGAAGAASSAGAASIPTSIPRAAPASPCSSDARRPEGCVLCDATASMRRVDASILSDYGVRVCVACKAREPQRWSQIVKTNAKKHFLLSDGVLSRLPHVTKSNPRNPHFKPMMMFLRYHVEQAAVVLYGSEEALEEERVERARKRALRAAKGPKQRKRRRKTLVKPRANDSNKSAQDEQQQFGLFPTGLFAEGGVQQAVRDGARTKQQQRQPTAESSWRKRGQHVHAFGPLTFDGASGMHIKTCACGFMRKFEVM